MTAHILIVEGYGRTQMQDVLAAALRFADGVQPHPAADELPVRAPAPGELAALTEYLQRRELRLPGPAPLVARTIVESCVLRAVHLTHGLVPETPKGRRA